MVNKLAGKQYLYRGHLVFTGALLEKSGEYRTYWMDFDGGFHCVNVKGLPPRKTRITAQKDLDRWAAERKLPVRGNE